TLKTITYSRARTRINEVPKIDVYVENEKIDTIECQNFTAQKGRVFDVDMRGILYDVPNEYLDKSDKIVFKDAKNDNVLPEAFVSVFSRDDEKYDELSFVRSLEEPIDEEKLKEFSFKDAIGLLGTEKNLEDKDFVYFVKLLEQQKYGVPFVIFCFNAAQKQKAKEIYGEEVEIVFPKNIEDIMKNVSIFLYAKTSKEGAFKTDLLTREKLLQHAPKTFVLDLEDKIEEDAFVNKITLPRADKEVEFSKSIISQILQGHEKFNEYKFMSSLAFIDEEKIKDLYCPNAIGFLATEENLADEDFVGYIKELMERFPDVELKGFCFDERQIVLAKNLFKKVQLTVVKDIYSLSREIEFFIWTLFGKVDLKIQAILTRKNDHILGMFCHLNEPLKAKNITLREYEEKLKELNYITYTNPTKLGFTSEQTNKYGHSHHLLVFNDIFQILTFKSIDLNQNAFEFHNFDILKYVLKNNTFKNYLIRLYNATTK
ncbi:MAG TPA: hypothetical protein CFH84_11545, partial [Sulfurimonas sp. UBA12504]